MTHSFNPFARPLAGLACCMALGLTFSTCVAARGAVVAQSAPGAPAALDRWLSTGLIVDWNVVCRVERGPVVDNPSPAPMLVLRPGADLAGDTTAAEEAADSEDAASSPADDTSPAEDGNMEYQYGQYGSRYGNKYDVNPAAPKSIGGVDNGHDDASVDGDEAGGTGDSTMADDSASSQTEDSDDCGHMTLAAALGAVVSDYADELAARYGYVTSAAARLLGWK